MDQGKQPTLGYEAKGPQNPTRWLGKVLAERYQIEQPLGEGAMGTVFVAKHLSLQKQVAVKMIQPQFTGNAVLAARFAREAMASAQIDHPHVVSAIDYGVLGDGSAFLVMPLVQGPSLREVLEIRKQLTVQQACAIGSQIADALVAAHALGIVHRDLKPENIVLEERPGAEAWVRVLDFGIARLETSGSDREQVPHRTLTRVGTIMGTPGYMAPEQALGEKTTEQTDLYALGVMLYEMLSGHLPFAGDDLSSILQQQLTAPFRSLTQTVHGPTVPVELDELIATMLSAQAASRPADALTVREILKRFTRAPSRMPAAIRHWPIRARWRRFVAMSAMLIGLLGVLGIMVWMGTKQHADVSGEQQEAQPEIRPEVQAQIELLLKGKFRERREAARWLRNYRPTATEHLPAYAIAVADFEIARGCNNRKASIRRIRDLKDPRALPALQRIANTPKSGCGFLSLGDCHACIRDAVNDAVRNLKRKPRAG